VGPRAGLDILENTKIRRPCLDQKADGDVEKLLEVVMEGYIFRDDGNGAQLCWCRDLTNSTIQNIRTAFWRLNSGAGRKGRIITPIDLCRFVSRQTQHFNTVIHLFILTVLNTVKVLCLCGCKSRVVY